MHRNAKEKDKKYKKATFVSKAPVEALLRYRGKFCEESDECADSVVGDDASVPMPPSDAQEDTPTVLGLSKLDFCDVLL